jgi:hypothetical protein
MAANTSLSDQSFPATKMARNRIKPLGEGTALHVAALGVHELGHDDFPQ